MAIVYQYDLNNLYVGVTDDYGGPMPYGCIATRPDGLDENNMPPLGAWYKLNAARTNWDKIEDHRKRRDAFGQEIEGSGTPFWLPCDTYQSPARYMDTPGPLPEGALLSQPEMTQAEKDAQRKQEIMARLVGIDSESIRPLRSVVDGTVTDYDRTKLLQLAAEAAELRTELESLQV